MTLNNYSSPSKIIINRSSANPVARVESRAAKPLNSTAKVVKVESQPRPITAVTRLLRGERGADGNSIAYDEFIPSLDRSIFQLSFEVSTPSLAQVYLNGQKQKYGLDYSISSSKTLLEWKRENYVLDEQDVLEIYYTY